MAAGPDGGGAAYHFPVLAEPPVTPQPAWPITLGPPVQSLYGPLKAPCAPFSRGCGPWQAGDPLQVGGGGCHAAVMWGVNWPPMGRSGPHLLGWWLEIGSCIEDGTGQLICGHKVVLTDSTCHDE